MPLVRPFVAALLLVVAFTRAATACPFCSAVSLTFAQEIAQSQAAVIARLVEPPPAAALAPRAEGPLPKAKFQVVKALKGADLVAAAGLAGPDGKAIETIVLDAKPVGTLALVFGIEPPELIWSSPVTVSDRAVEYLEKLAGLPEKGADRLAFFQDFLEDADETLARDAYDEFAIAPYADLKGLEDRMDAARLLAWIEDPKVQANRRRLYATMLGVCGRPDDAARIERLLVGDGLSPDEAEARSGLDALIACYVALRGTDALDLVDRQFLERKGRAVPFAETYAAVMALRFLGEESALVPRDRVLQSLRILLGEPKLADLVIADLARWQDWSVVDRVVTLFKEATADTIFVREPVVNYLRACPLPEAAAAVKELETIDPEAVRRAATLAGLAGVVAGAGAARPATGDGADGGAASVAPVGPTADDAALAGRIAPVLGDEEATDEVPGAAPPPPPRPAPASQAAPQPRWKWAVWAAAVLVIAAVARTLLRPGASGPAAR
ncbi:MAG: hypothetical protein ACKOSQ_03305 [Planctomycetaceae bacterium]